MKGIVSRPDRRPNPPKGVPTPDKLGTLDATKRQRAWVKRKVAEKAAAEAAKAKRDENERTVE